MSFINEISFIGWFFIVLFLIIIGSVIALELVYGSFSEVLNFNNNKKPSEEGLSVINQENEDSSSENGFNIFSSRSNNNNNNNNNIPLPPPSLPT